METAPEEYEMETFPPERQDWDFGEEDEAVMEWDNAETPFMERYWDAVREEYERDDPWSKNIWAPEITGDEDESTLAFKRGIIVRSLVTRRRSFSTGGLLPDSTQIQVSSKGLRVTP